MWQTSTAVLPKEEKRCHSSQEKVVADATHTEKVVKIDAEWDGEMSGVCGKTAVLTGEDVQWSKSRRRQCRWRIEAVRWHTSISWFGRDKPKKAKEQCPLAIKKTTEKAAVYDDRCHYRRTLPNFASHIMETVQYVDEQAVQLLLLLLRHRWCAGEVAKKWRVRTVPKMSCHSALEHAVECQSVSFANCATFRK